MIDDIVNAVEGSGIDENVGDDIGGRFKIFSMR